MSDTANAIEVSSVSPDGPNTLLLFFDSNNQGVDVLPSAITHYTSVLRIFAAVFVLDWVTSKDCPEVSPPP